MIVKNVKNMSSNVQEAEELLDFGKLKRIDF